jgi:hypothetical protein
MGMFFTRERFGMPQVLAGCLLLVFVAQCVWLIAHQPVGVIAPEELARVQEGWAQWYGRGVAGTPTGLVSATEGLRMRGSQYDPDHSPLWYLIESAPVALFGVAPDSRAWLWLTRLPFVFIGTLLGASLWYVSRRLYGNAGGYTALTLYSFSPAVVRASTLWFAPPNIAAAWGTFGAVFTAIAVSHTLYAPREVVLWNWRRILLLGISLTLAVGSHFSLVLIVPVLLVFMLYLAPHRGAAVVAILATGCGAALLLLFAAYFFHPALFAHGLANAVLFRGAGAALRLWGAYLQVGHEIAASGPVLALTAPVGLAVWAVSRRSRYFGNSAPLVVALFFMVLRVLSPHEAGLVYGLLAAMFLFVFVAGIVADLLETRARELGMAVVTGLLAANALWSLIGIARIGG